MGEGPVTYETDVNPYRKPKTADVTEIQNIVDEAMQDFVQRAHIPYGEYQLTKQDLWYIGMIVRTVMRDGESVIVAGLEARFGDKNIGNTPD